VVETDVGPDQLAQDSLHPAVVDEIPEGRVPSEEFTLQREALLHHLLPGSRKLCGLDGFAQRQHLRRIQHVLEHDVAVGVEPVTVER
jgi:hypothetical protein